jgi:DNA-binding response OmpR family regulator
VVRAQRTTTREDRVHHERFGGDNYLIKPFDLDDLLQMVSNLVGGA